MKSRTGYEFRAFGEAIQKGFHDTPFLHGQLSGSDG